MRFFFVEFIFLCSPWILLSVLLHFIFLAKEDNVY